MRLARVQRRADCFIVSHHSRLDSFGPAF